MGWSDAEKTAEKHSSGGIFVRLQNDKDKVTGAFVGEPEASEAVWDKQLKRYFTTESEEGKNAIKAGSKPTAKFKFNFYDKKEKVMKVYECGIVTFKDVLKVRDKYGLDKKFFDIERSGKAGDTKTTYSILPDDPIDEETQKAIKACVLHDLKKVEDTEGGEASGGFESGKGAAVVASDKIDDKTKERLLARLKPLPREKVEKFTTRFGIAKVKELLTKDVETAEAFITELEGGKPAAPAEATNDPFAD